MYGLRRLAAVIVMSQTTFLFIYHLKKYVLGCILFEFEGKSPRNNTLKLKYRITCKKTFPTAIFSNFLTFSFQPVLAEKLVTKLPFEHGLNEGTQPP